MHTIHERHATYMQPCTHSILTHAIHARLYVDIYTIAFLIFVFIFEGLVYSLVILHLFVG